MSDHLQTWLDGHGYGQVARRRSVTGGCINDCERLHLADGSTLFVKANQRAPADMFQAEAVGLQALAEVDALRIPAVLGVQADFLVLEDLGDGERGEGFWESLGAGLARLHGIRHPAFGFSVDNYCGATPQRNDRLADGHEFFRQHRLLALARKAHRQGLLDGQLLDSLDSIASRLEQLVPDQPAVLVHGDLWSGNVHCCASGEPALIDPACYWGWAEADLAMTLLFGGFSAHFYSSYESESGLDPAWRERAPLYNLYHLLNHLLLFGSGYLGQIQQATARFG